MKKSLHKPKSLSYHVLGFEFHEADGQFKYPVITQFMSRPIFSLATPLSASLLAIAGGDDDEVSNGEDGDGFEGDSGDENKFRKFNV